jgi:transposase InsO family protein
MKWERLLKQQYYTAKKPSSYAGVQNLARATKKKPADVLPWLQEQDTYTLHKPVRHTFPRRKVISPGPGYQWQADLVDVANIKSHNDGYTFLLTVIDVFSKQAWCIPLKNKSATSLVAAFESLLNKHKVQNLQTDKGKEFLNKPLQALLKKHKVNFFTTHNEETKASIAERFNRTLKTKMWKYFTQHNTRRYVDILDDLLYSYNRTYHRSIKMAPVDVNDKNKQTVWENLYGKFEKFVEPKLEEGDTVRISKAKRQFRKGYLPNWSDEIFTVHQVKTTQPPVYVLKDYHDEVLEGTFYEQELQKVKVSADKLYLVESVLKTRKRRGKKEYFVKWKGYPDSFNEWVTDVYKA